MLKYILPGLLCLGACSPPILANAVSANEAQKTNEARPTKTAMGRASFYGGSRNGKMTSSGQLLDPVRMTAAHRNLPFGTKVRVTNLANNHTCNVEITDRGPALWTGRIIDVSEEAARCLEMFRSGVVPVRLEIPG